MVHDSWSIKRNLKTVPGASNGVFGVPKVIKRYFSRRSTPKITQKIKTPLPPIIIPSYESVFPSSSTSSTTEPPATTTVHPDEKDAFFAQLEGCKLQKGWEPNNAVHATLQGAGLDKGPCCTIGFLTVIAPKRSVTIREIRKRMREELLRSMFGYKKAPCGLTLFDGIRGTWEDFEAFSD
jgi:hypothetical protein